MVAGWEVAALILAVAIQVPALRLDVSKSASRLAAVRYPHRASVATLRRTGEREVVECLVIGLQASEMIENDTANGSSAGRE